jgi:hypothetical protein
MLRQLALKLEGKTQKNGLAACLPLANGYFQANYSALTDIL